MKDTIDQGISTVLGNFLDDRRREAAAIDERLAPLVDELSRVVFSGGKGCQMFGQGTPMYCGDESGASFPYPGVYPSLVVPETVAGGSSLPRHPGRTHDPTAAHLLVTTWRRLGVAGHRRRVP